jgi:hypothetical protein
MRMTLAGDSRPTRIDLALIKTVARARKWADDLIWGRVHSVTELARQQGIDRRSVQRLIRLGFAHSGASL